jgi:hypothetical protein
MLTLSQSQTCHHKKNQYGGFGLRHVASRAAAETFCYCCCPSKLSTSQGTTEHIFIQHSWLQSRLLVLAWDE